MIALHELASALALMVIGLIGGGAVTIILSYLVLPLWWRHQDRRELRRQEDRAEALLTRERLGMRR